jgi:hypothetical protein
MEGVTSNEEALRRCSKYGAVPKLTHTGPISPDMDAEDLIGGVYGEGSAKARQFKEMTQGQLFSKGFARNPDLIHIAEGTKDLTFTVKGQANMAKQWGEFADYWIKQGDPVEAEKYMSRLAADLRVAGERAGADASGVTKELRQLVAALKAANDAKPPVGEAALAGMRLQLAGVMNRAQYQTSILGRLDGASANQANMLRTLLDAADKPDSKLYKYMNEAIEKLGGAAKYLDFMGKVFFGGKLIWDLGQEEYGTALKDLIGEFNLPLELASLLLDEVMASAAALGYNFVASRQACDDLLEGIFIGGNVEASKYTIDRLVDEQHSEAELQKWVRARSNAAYDRGWSGPATDKVQNATGEIIYNKCYPDILQNWQATRKQILAEYTARWSEYAAGGLMLTAQPNPATLDATTGKVTVEVTGEIVAETIDKAAGYGLSAKLESLSKRLTGEKSDVTKVFQVWSPPPDGGKMFNSSQNFTFTAPGDYEIRASIRLSIENRSTVYLDLPLAHQETREGQVMVHVVKPEDKPLCGGGPVIKSATRTTLEHDVIPVGPGQVAKPGVYITAAGDFSETDPKTGLAIGWQVREGMRYCEGCNCLPPKEIGSFEIAASGRIKAVLESERNVPVLFTMGSSNTSIGLYFEPKIGQVYGKGVELLTAGSSGTNNPVPYRLEREADVSGPGRISAVIFAPRSSGSFTHACFDQSYTAKVEVLSIGKKSPVNGETKLGIGDHIRTDGSGEAIIVMPWGGLRKLMPNSDLSIERVPSTSPDTDCQEWTLTLNSGRMRVWSASIEEAEGGGGIQAGSYTVKP